MKRYIRNIMVPMMLLGSAMEAGAVLDRVDGSWGDFSSSDKNTSSAEMPMSAYKDGTIAFFRNDSAYTFRVTEDLGVDSLVYCPELTGLGIDGTFAYDAARNKIYFSKKGKSEKNDLYEASWVDGTWAKVNMLTIKGVSAQTLTHKNSSLVVSRWVQQGRGASGFYNPSLGKDGSRIYFSGEFKAGQGARDLWYIDRESDGVWSRPKAIDTVVVNGKAKEDFPLVVGDSLLFFSSDREGTLGGMDVYYSKINKNGTYSKPVALNDAVNSSADDYNVVFGAEKGAFFISDRKEGKGAADIYSAAVFHLNPDADLDPEEVLSEPKGFLWVLCFFDLDKSDMKPAYEVQLDELVEAMNEYPDGEFEISGHTDLRGAADYNQRLSEDRAKTVKKLLVKRGFPANRIKAVGKGLTEPIVPNAQTEPEHEQNRRVEVRLIEPEVEQPAASDNEKKGEE
ncbi:MAG: OmpA family protein [Paludibacteraceae bacterium]|nr:OmpA family protein [Paludibacteraceae bacterium]